MKERLFKYASSGNLESISSLFDGGVDVVTETDEDGNSALLFASYWGHLNIVKFLVHHNADTNQQNDHGMTALGAACQSGMAEIVAYLLEMGADNSATNADGETLLMVAAKDGNKSTVLNLIDSGLDASYQDGFGFTAAMYTPFNLDQSEGLDILKLLIEKGANWKIENNEGKSVEKYADENDNNLMLSYLEKLLNKNTDKHTKKDV